MIPLKFKVRIRHYYEGEYCIEFAYYRFIPIWNKIHMWLEPPLKYKSSEGWHILTADVKSAEERAKRFNTILDIKNHYHKYEEQIKEFDKDREEYWEKSIPLKIKNIL